MRIKMKVVVVLVSCLLSSGCSYPLSQLRTKEPYRTLISTKSPKDLAKCLDFKLRQSDMGSVSIVALEEYPTNTYHVPLIFRDVAYVDFLVKPMEGGSVVEFRKLGSLKADLPEIEKILEQCMKNW